MKRCARKALYEAQSIVFNFALFISIEKEVNGVLHKQVILAKDF